MRALPEDVGPSSLRFWLPGIFAVIILSFIAATGIAHWQLRAMDRTVLEIADTAAPSIERLAAARSAVRLRQAELRDELARSARGESTDPTSAGDRQRTLDRTLDEYLTLPVLPKEQEQWTTIVRDKQALDEEVARFEQLLRRGDLNAAALALSGPIDATVTHLNGAIAQAIAADANQVHQFTLQIQALRARSSYAAFGLDVLCALIATAGAIILRRTIKAHTALVERNRRLHQERESALDEFSGRVAHDILSPLNTVSLALELTLREGADEQQRRKLLVRGTAALDRVKRLVTGLLDFARAGGKPVAGARADLGGTIADLVAELQPTAAAAGAELGATCDGAVFVGCSPGVLTSLIANLARNAIKYIGDGPVRRIEIRALEREGAVRVEVEDTGPGLSPEIESRVFEPYIRSPSTSQPGVGLGLATVKRLAEAHAGKVGVRSLPGRGCTFWFELPKALANQV